MEFATLIIVLLGVMLLLAVVVNLVIALVGFRALSSLPVQQYPDLQSSSVIITTTYTGASAETVRGFLTTPIERAVSAIGGVDHVESSSRAGISTVNVRLKLNHDSTKALAEVTARASAIDPVKPQPAGAFVKNQWRVSTTTPPVLQQLAVQTPMTALSPKPLQE